MSKHTNDDYSGIMSDHFGADPEEFFEEHPELLGRKGNMHIGYRTQELKAAAKLMQSMADDFERMAEACELYNGHGGCKRHPDGCSALSCPLPQLSAQKIKEIRDGKKLHNRSGGKCKTSGRTSK